MLKFLAHDTVNDVAIIKTSFGFNVRYGLQVENFVTLWDALTSFADCQRHAMAAEMGEEYPD